jgi:hypothetical protein
MSIGMSDIVLPILHKIQDSLAALDRKVTAQSRDLTEVRQDVRMIRSTFHDIGETRVTEGEITVLHEDVNRVLGRMRDLEVRVEHLEVGAAPADHSP